MGEQNNGWFKVYHSASEILYETRLVWDKHSAYVDLARRANLGGGTLSVSVSKIAREYSWSRGKAHRFVDSLRRAGLLEKEANGQETDTPTNTLELVFTGLHDERRTPQRTGDGHPPDGVTRAHAGARSDLSLKIKINPIGPSFSLPEWIDSEAWEGWLEMRKKKKAPNTERAFKLAVTALEKLKTQGQNVTEVINNATLRGYTGFFPVKADNRQRTQTNLKVLS